MQRSGPISRGIAIATLLCFASPQAEAIELYGAGAAATQVEDGPIVQVRGGGHGGGHARHGGGMHRGGGRHVAHRGNVHAANCNVNRKSIGTSTATSTGTSIAM